MKKPWLLCELIEAMMSIRGQGSGIRIQESGVRTPPTAYGGHLPSRALLGIQGRLRCYSELIKMKSFEERFAYLNLNGIPFEETFGYDRYLNQRFYTSDEWRHIRDKVIIRDDGCDLGCEGYPIKGRIYLHHMNPVGKLDILEHSDLLVDPEYLICVSYMTHQAIHYGNLAMTGTQIIERKPGDTCLWKK